VPFQVADPELALLKLKVLPAIVSVALSMHAEAAQEKLTGSPAVTVIEFVLLFFAVKEVIAFGLMHGLHCNTEVYSTHKVFGHITLGYAQPGITHKDCPGPSDTHPHSYSSHIAPFVMHSL
jgi:hypothetical protein